MITAVNISKSFQSTQALTQVSVQVEKGELFGFIGPDGSGKTTLFRILTTLMLADEGSATVGGYDVLKDFKKIRNITGYMPGSFSLYHDLSIEENLRFYATIFGTTIQENYHLIRDIYTQIEPFKDRPAGKLSGGMKQKLALSCALIHRPDILFLDEPTTGVDAVSRKEFWEMLRSLKTQGITIVVSTPYMDEARLCDRIALMQDGRLLSVDQPDQLTAKFKKTIYAIKTHNMYQLLKDMRNYPHMHSVYPFGQFAHYIDKRQEDVQPELEHYLISKQHLALHIKQQTATIEDCFMDLAVRAECIIL